MPIVSEGIYVLTSVVAGTVVEIPNGNAASTVQAFHRATDKRSLYQLWYLYAPDWNQDVYTVQSLSTGTFLTIDTSTYIYDTPVTARATKADSNAQKWAVKKNDKMDAYVFTSMANKTVMDLAASARADGTPVLSYPFHGGPNQAWKLTPIGRSSTEVAALVSRYSHVKISYDLDLTYLPLPQEIYEQIFEKNQAKTREIRPGLYDRDAFAIASKADFNATVVDLIKAKIPDVKVAFLYGIMYGINQSASEHRAYNFCFKDDKMDELRFFDPQEGNVKEDLEFHTYMALY